MLQLFLEPQTVRYSVRGVKKKKKFVQYSSVWLLNSRVIPRFFVQILWFKNYSNCLFPSMAAFSFQMIFLLLSTHICIAQILSLTAVKCSSKLHPWVNLKWATGQRTKPTFIPRTSSVTSCRELWCWVPQDLLKGRSLVLKNRKMTSWRIWRGDWRSWLVWWTWSKLRYSLHLKYDFSCYNKIVKWYKVTRVCFYSLKNADLQLRVQYLEGCECVRQTCVWEGREVADGQRWQTDQNTVCTCTSGEVTCQADIKGK